MTRHNTSDYQRLFLQDIPIMDVRAPVEYQKGAFPNSQNIPLINNIQRQVIGTCYKNSGQEAAIALGLKLVTPEMKELKLDQWKHFTERHPEGYLYCFRGGLRSCTTQTWLKEQGINYPLITGGYKAMRTYLLEQLDISVQQIPFVILSGLTGSGKTRVLKKTNYHTDLEGLANHRGSAFGCDVNDFQPSQINWENLLSISALKHRARYPKSGLLLEDEGKRIGRLHIPPYFHKKMTQSPCIFLECTLERRVAIIQEDYFTRTWPLYQQRYKTDADEKFCAYLMGALLRIKKRLGGVLYKKIHASFTLALDHLLTTGESHLFTEGIYLLLQEYYDPMYHYQLQQKQSKILFRGTEPDILAWANESLNEMIQ